MSRAAFAQEASPVHAVRLGLRQSYPESNDNCQNEGCQDVSCKFSTPNIYSKELFETEEGVFDEVAVSVPVVVIDNCVFAIAPAKYDRNHV